MLPGASKAVAARSSDRISTRGPKAKPSPVASGSSAMTPATRKLAYRVVTDPNTAISREEGAP